MNYFKQFWDEEREDEYANWGTSTWYFETNESDEISKQITVYNNNKVLKYSDKNIKDLNTEKETMNNDNKNFKIFFLIKGDVGIFIKSRFL